MRKTFGAMLASVALFLCACTSGNLGQSALPSGAATTYVQSQSVKATSGFPVIHVFDDSPPGPPGSQQAMFVESGTETCMPYVFDNGHNSEIVYTARSKAIPIEGTLTPKSVGPNCTQVWVLANTYWGENRLTNGGVRVKSDGSLYLDANDEAFVWDEINPDGSVNFYYASQLMPHNSPPGGK